MIQLDQLSIRRGGRVLFQKASMQLHPGWKIGLTGVNGAGKSTLFSALLGGMESDTGSLTRPAVWTVAHMAQEIYGEFLPCGFFNRIDILVTNKNKC